ncbi:MAG: DM13 domain-containing protein [Nocardioidaceae bacterium]|nr:DM13 domain-containing protein [Nocardioidaceae bacterium]MCL2614108.1 DM13 domain-containing protein [Nocardioidaceae bacterium]
MRKLTLAVAGLAAASLTACGSTHATTTSGASPMMHDSASSTMSAHMTGMLSGVRGKQVSGTVTISGGRVVLSGFSAAGGMSDLHLYLAAGTSESSLMQGTDLGPIRGGTTQTFRLGHMGASGEHYALVHSPMDHTVLGTARLS